MRGHDPDHLTPREREVLDLIRHGLTNEEIAQRLDITLDGAKYHVSQILSKLGVASREEAASLALGKRRRWWARWPMWAKIAGAATMVVALTWLAVLAWGIGDTGSKDSGSSVQLGISRTTDGPTPVPWVNSAPGPTPSPSPFPSLNPENLAVRACRGQEVRGEQYGDNGAGGWIFVYLRFTNVSSEPCRLEGVPAIQFLDANGELLQTNRREDPCLPSSLDSCQHEVALLLPDSGQTPIPEYRLKPGQASIALMYWGRLFELPSYTPCPWVASAIAVDLPESGGRVVVPLPSPMDACVSPGVSQFRPAPSASPTPVERRTLAVHLELPETVMAGKTLNFVARISNISPTTPFVFGALCPEYVIILGTKEAQSWHSLNCGPANSIPPGDSVAFAMELAIPEEITPGSYFIDWTLSGVGYVVFAGAGSVTDKTPYTVTVVPQ